MLQGKGLLTPIQRRFLSVFIQTPDHEHFYLTGGTALAEYYLGHRLSFDLDLFTSNVEIIVPTSYQLEELCRLEKLQLTVTRRFASYVEFLIGPEEETLKVDLALDSPFRFSPPVLSDTGVWVNSFEDIKADKTLAYYGRAEPRDAVDLYFLIQQQPFADLLDLAAQKDPGFDLYWMAVALNRALDFPDDLERWPVKLLVPCDPVQIKQTFRTLALDLMDQITSS